MQKYVSSLWKASSTECVDKEKLLETIILGIKDVPEWSIVESIVAFLNTKNEEGDINRTCKHKDCNISDLSVLSFMNIKGDYRVLVRCFSKISPQETDLLMDLFIRNSQLVFSMGTNTTKCCEVANGRDILRYMSIFIDSLITRDEILEMETMRVKIESLINFTKDYSNIRSKEEDVECEIGALITALR
eukprot:GHVP01005300.1.p1 GENE.GHVP01005300.1~~GHVP01005300.1.p1  ORF type:complete len:217 (+),score=28.47 GHVP01005300.1:86-652(+)